MAELVGDHVDRFTEVTSGQSFTIGPFAIETFGGIHAAIHPDMPEMANISYLIDGKVYHPGDSYELPGVPVETLLMPTSGPWTSVRQGIDFLRGIDPTRAYQVHELELSEAGQEYAMYFLNLVADVARSSSSRSMNPSRYNASAHGRAVDPARARASTRAVSRSHSRTTTANCTYSVRDPPFHGRPRLRPD
ncbi:hypothetical protein MRBLWH7_003433 [Microbacterium sp. LWH7-1.2]|uniref:MBL fold metallo-hydrolase n=1 Tax=Microbacterium sp. LWH7-1.2 TaxID=3135257 RepID=UPI003139AEF8